MSFFDKLRNASEGVFFKIIFGLIALSFLSWGIIGYLGGSKIKPAIQMSGYEISQSELDNLYKLRLRFIRRSTDKKISDVVKEQILSQIIEGLVLETVLKREAQNLGLVVTDEKAIETIRDSSEFKDENGNFSQNIYLNYLYANGYSEAQFIRLTKDNIQKNLLTNAVMTGVISPQVKADALYKIRNDKRKILAYIIDSKKTDISSKPSDSNLRETYKNNKEKFMLDEMRKVSYLFINKDKFPTFSALYQKSDEVLDDIAMGKSLKEIAKESDFKYVDLPFINNKAIKENGKKISLKKNELPPDFLSQVFAAEAKIESMPIEVENGITIFKVEEIIEPRALKFSQVEDQVRAIWYQNEQMRKAAKTASEVQEALNKNRQISFSNVDKIQKTISQFDDTRLSPKFISEVFYAPVGQIVQNKDDNKYEIGKSLEIIDPNINRKDDQYGRIMNSVATNLSENLMQEYINHLKEKYDVEINWEQINKYILRKGEE
jgi:parvulin-like peptidyl-prolyl isomerase